jgi:hypothetical protein
MQVGADAPLQEPGQVGLNHTAWRVETLDDLKDFYHRLRDKGVPVASVVDHGISLGIYFHDSTAMASRSITSCRAPNGRVRSEFFADMAQEAGPNADRLAKRPKTQIKLELV